jgi:hypothetical protein
MSKVFCLSDCTQYTSSDQINLLILQMSVDLDCVYSFQSTDQYFKV